MAKLTTKARGKLSGKSFVFPRDRRYPIHDAAHARNALARVSQHGTAGEKRMVRVKVAKRYPGIGRKR